MLSLPCFSVRTCRSARYLAAALGVRSGRGFGVIGLTLALAGCVDGVAPAAPKSPICKCAPPAACPANVCDLQIDVSAKTCSGQVSKVEVLIGDELEPEVFEVGTPRRSCATMARGATVSLRARSDTTWQWVEDVVCPAAAMGDVQGPTVVRVLNCTVAPGP